MRGVWWGLTGWKSLCNRSRGVKCLCACYSRSLATLGLSWQRSIVDWDPRMSVCLHVCLSPRLSAFSFNCYESVFILGSIGLLVDAQVSCLSPRGGVSEVPLCWLVCQLSSLDISGRWVLPLGGSYRSVECVCVVPRLGLGLGLSLGCM
jgi:hypothetical protein